MLQNTPVISIKVYVLMQKAMLLLVATFQTILTSYLLSAVAPYIPQGRRHYGV